MSHWREIVPSPYLGSWDLDKENDTVVKIKKAPYKKKISELQGAEKIVIELEGMKPLLANSTNMKNIEKALGTADYTKWVGMEVKLYVGRARSVQDGDEVDAIRVRREKPAPIKAKIPEEQWENALNAVRNGTWTVEKLIKERDLTQKQIDELRKISAAAKGK